MAGCDPPEPIPIYACGNIEPVINRVRRLNFHGDTRLPVIEIDVRFEQREAA